MNGQEWYEVVDQSLLVQGDLLSRCPVPQLSANWLMPLAVEGVSVAFVATNVIVMTQSCDLENKKVTHVLLAKWMAWEEIVRQEVARANTAMKSKEFRRKLIEGSIPGFSLLHKHEAEPKRPWSIIDFHHLYTLPKAFLEQYAQSLGPRLRLRSPYREHLAQAFARYFMRVGLPHDAKEFEKEGDVAVKP